MGTAGETPQKELRRPEQLQPQLMSRINACPTVTAKVQSTSKSPQLTTPLNPQNKEPHIATPLINNLAKTPQNRSPKNKSTSKSREHRDQQGLATDKGRPPEPAARPDPATKNNEPPENTTK